MYLYKHRTKKFDYCLECVQLQAGRSESMMQKNNLWRYSLFLAFLTTLSFSCRSSPTGTHITEKVQLSAEYVTCTEVWLKVGFTDSPNGGNFAINRDGNGDVRNFV